jgi:NADPH:quinone reductase-like Zn-dependent oxidoreductase
MEKVVIRSAGSYDKLEVKTGLPIPHPGRGEVLVRVHASGVNYADCCVRMGLYASAKKYVGWPITPGFEFAGEITEVGAGVDEEQVGSSVVGVSLFGAYASYIVVPEDQVFSYPKGIEYHEIAALPAVYLTAYWAMFELAHPRAGQILLVHSAAGGVGGALVQLGKIAGCEVVGVVGASHKVDAVYELGADHVIDKSKQKLWDEAKKLAPDGYDAVFDANGVETLRQSYAHLTAGGKLVVYGFHTMLPRTGGKPNWLKLAWDWLWTPSFSPLNMTTDNKSVMAFNLSFMFHKKALLREMFAQLLTWLEEGKLRLPPQTLFPIRKVADAHKLIESGQSIGKLILTFDHGHHQQEPEQEEQQE